MGQFWSSFGFHFGARSGVLEFVCNSRGPEGCPKMESSSCLRWNSVTLVALTLPILGWSVSRLKTVDPPKRNGLGKKKVPKNETQNKDQNLTSKSGPKMESGGQNLYRGANKVYMIFFQRSARRLGGHASCKGESWMFALPGPDLQIQDDLTYV